MAPKVELRRMTTIPAFACPDDRGFAMARVSVEVPAEVVDPIRETVLLLLQATAESLHLSLKSREEERGSLEDVRLHHTRLAALDELLDALDAAPPGGATPRAGALRVEAPRDLLHDALYGALIDAGERLAETSNACWRGDLPLERVQAAAEEVLTIDRLLRELRG
jgi:hypothetical protein